MFDFTEILRQAQGGEAFANLGRQYGLSPDQTRAAVEAMMPAFAAAMQRQLTDPAAFQAFLAAMAGQAGTPRNPYLDAMAAFSPESQKAGADALTAIFGSNEVTRAVAAQVAAMSGIGPNVLQSMMPVVASMLMGGMGSALETNPIAKMVSGFFAAARPASPQEAFAGMMAEAWREGAAKGPAAFADLMGQFARQVPRPAEGTESVEEMLKRTPNPAAEGSPIEEAFGAFVRGFNRGRPEPAPEPEAAPDDFSAFVGQLFKAGEAVQATQAQAFEQIFDQFWGKPGKR
ncbi:DUF937 domain-containing protein [Prosthecomicrobium sp. N25]|uniref:DUF937 domain-containing protein n=1 Tax=Prosthecomicrobium sp. N25 TaxID=3129254 RepID=UPI003076D369